MGLAYLIGLCPRGTIRPMSKDQLAQLGSAYRRSKATAESHHAALKDAIIQAYRAGVGTVEIARRTGQDRESVRRIRVVAENAGLLPPAG